MEAGFADIHNRDEALSSGVSWAAVLGGAFVSASLSLILLALGAGLGLSSVSPWSNQGATASTVGTVAIVWLIFIQIVAFAMGGYLAGRLRTRWATIHTDEVYFRDTAHGFLVWAVGLVIAVFFLTSAAASMVGGAQATAAASGEAAQGPKDYFIDTLFRSDHPGTNRDDTSARAEADRIFVHALGQDAVAPSDSTYLGQLVAAKTGLSQVDAEKRVSDTISQARQAADTARKATAHVLLWLFLALLIGAFCASFAATIGGRQRDHVKPL
jgi:hypothetical protein